MQPTAYPVRHEILRQYWVSFMTTGQIEEIDGVAPDPAVIQSWRRCAPRADPRSRPRPITVKEQSLAAVLKAQSELITVAIPHIEDVHQFIEGSGCAILLAEATGCIVNVSGDQAAVELVNDYALGQGSYWAEGPIGTNALSISLANAAPCQVVGAEHYFEAYHHLVSTAAPVHDVNGRIIGLLAIVGLVETTTPYTLGLVMAAARSISNQLQVTLFLDEANRRLTEINAILDAFVGGILTWDSEGKIKHMNVQAGQMLHLNPATALGRPLVSMVDLPAVVVDAMQNKRELHDAEANFNVNGQTIRSLLRLRYVVQGDGQPVGFIALLRPIEYVRHLVHQQVGSQASLTLEDIPAQSTVMRATLRQARIAARGTAPVMLRGEGGVGKNHLARAIHDGGERADKPFIAINCQAIPHELIVSEFLGYEKEAGDNGRPSKFELSHGGTLFFDQIETLSLEMQAALAHVIETGLVMRLGGVQPIPVDVRIIVATSVDLEQYVTDGRFLSDLYYRFGVFNITLPRLRERVEDLPLLAERFLARITLRSQRPAWIDDEALAVLCRYPWPGNVRELENVLERGLYNSQDNVIRIGDLPEGVRHGRVLKLNSPQPLPAISAAEAEREAILRAGWACRGRVTEMTQQLGIGRTTLWRKMKRLNLSPDYFKR